MLLNFINNMIYIFQINVYKLTKNFNNFKKHLNNII